MLKYTVRCLSSVSSVAVRRPIAITSIASTHTTARPIASPVVISRQVSFFKAPSEASGIPDEKDHAKGRDLEQVQSALAGEERFALGEIRGPFGTFANPTVITSANPERVVGCLGDGAEYEHSLLWMLVKDNGKKHMCQACGQFFILKRDASAAAAPIH